MELQERVKEGQSSLVIAGLEAQGQAKPAVAQLGLSIDDVKDAVLVAVDGAQCAGTHDRDDIVQAGDARAATTETLRFRLPRPTGVCGS